MCCKGQTRLYNSLSKYGSENHKMEIIENVINEELNTKERFWQDYYDSAGINGLNCYLTETNEKVGVVSDVTKQKLRDFNLGKKHTEETCVKMSKSHKGKKFSDEHKANLSKVRKGMFAGDKNPNYGKVGAMKGKKGVLSPTFVKASER